ncbi:MAG: glycoside hydrolase family 92 protein [Rhodanobacteraceae bacterium]|nr:MAG: glycoside hydrolase family 92 protein [Rhodanobacteraceae bacterium]
MAKHGLATAICAIALVAGSVACARTPSDPAALVNPFIGTGSGGKITGDVDTFPGAVVPFGMLSWSPTTTSRPEGGDYSYANSRILGFSLTHLSGPGCSAAGEIPILPTVGAIGTQPDKTTAPFEHAHEHATPGEYQVTLAPGTASAIVVKLAASTRTGIGVFHFPATRQANFLFKVSEAQTTSPTSSVRIVGNDALAGAETSGRFCGTARTATLYFVVKFNRPFAAHGTWGESAPKAGSDAATGAHTGAWVSFDANQNRDIDLKVAISYVSVADAWANLKAENPGWDFAAVASQAHAAWDNMLSRITVSGGTHDQQVQFYTALYHSLLHPNVFSDANGDYIGFDDKLHQLAHGQGNQYANFSGWDIYRSEVPLLALLAPHRTGDMITSLLNDAKQGGWLPKWGYDNDYTGVMNGDPADPIIAEAYAFGARNFDAKAALAAMLKGATQTPEPGAWSGTYIERPHLLAYERLGYVPGNASETLEYASADFAIADFAKSLGDTATYRKFLTRAASWKNVFDAKAQFDGFSGFMEARGVDGAFPSGPAFQIGKGAYGQQGFEEGNAIQYTWMVPQDLHGLIQAMGGDKLATARLDRYFEHLNVGPSEPYYWAGNEMCLNDPWIYDYTGAPWKTQGLVHRLITHVYSATPGGEPGNDDLGAMSSWLVWAYLGMYPETPGAPALVLGAPVFPRVSMRLRDGRTVTLAAPNASTQTYVRGVEVNGKTWQNDWLPASLLLGSGHGDSTTHLAFAVGTTPDTAWAASQANAPPSWQP